MPHTRILYLLCTLAFLSGSATAAEEYSLSGEWYFDVLTSPNGPGSREVLFAQEGDQVIGFIESNSASGRFVGRLDGNDLQFTAVLEFGGQPMGANYTATVDGDKMTGEIEYGLYGKATFVGFRGRRPLEATAQDAVLIGSALDAAINASSVGDDFGVSGNGVLMPEMIQVKGGSFEMGNNGPAVNPDFGKDFAFVHTVEVSDFQMSRFLVTNAQFLAYSEATGREPPLSPKGWGDYLHLYPNHPVTNVNFYDAEGYVEWLSGVSKETYRLPTEAEWEYAARAGIEGENFVFGDEWIIDGANISIWRMGEIPDRDGWKVWWDDEGERMSKSEPMTTRVGSFPPNRWGFYDMVGQVWEWTMDFHQSDYYEDSPKKDPIGPATGDEKVLRGCSWYNKPDVCFNATRDRYAPEVRLYYNGFRVVAGGASGTH